MKKIVLLITSIGIILIIVGVMLIFTIKSEENKIKQLDEKYFEYQNAKYEYRKKQNYWTQTVKNVSNQDIYIDYVVTNAKSNLVENKDIYLGNISIKKKIKKNSSFEIKVPITLEENETFFTTYVFYGRK